MKKTILKKALGVLLCLTPLLVMICHTAQKHGWGATLFAVGFMLLMAVLVFAGVILLID